MLKKSGYAVIGAIACVLSACGATLSSSSTGGTAPVRDAPDAASVCELLVDAETYTKVVDAWSAPGTAVGAWLRTRSTSGARAPDLEKRYAGVASITVCLMDAPGIAIPTPPKLHRTDGPEVDQYAIVLLGVDEEPVLDSVGPAPKVEALFARLVHPTEGASPG